MATESDELIGVFADTPGQFLSQVAINNLMIDDPGNPPYAIGLDIHPSTGDIYLLQSDLRLYTVDSLSGDATLLGQALASLGLTSPDIRAMDFDSVTEEIRLLDGTTGDSYRISATDASLIGQDTALQFATGDANEGRTVFAIGLSYDGPQEGGTRTAFVLDEFNDVLARLGDEGDSGDSANAGSLSTIGPWDFTQASFGLSATVNGEESYTISQSDTDSDQTVLRKVDLGSGTSTAMGQIGNVSTRYVALALAVVPVNDDGGSTSPSPSPTASPGASPTATPGATATPTATPGASPTATPGDGGDGGLVQTCIDQGTDAGFPEAEVVLFCETVFGNV